MVDERAVGSVARLEPRPPKTRPAYRRQDFCSSLAQRVATRCSCALLRCRERERERERDIDRRGSSSTAALRRRVARCADRRDAARAVTMSTATATAIASAPASASASASALRSKPSRRQMAILYRLYRLYRLYVGPGRSQAPSNGQTRLSAVSAQCQASQPVRSLARSLALEGKKQTKKKREDRSSEDRSLSVRPSAARLFFFSVDRRFRLVGRKACRACVACVCGREVLDLSAAVSAWTNQ